jgi:hypothetical protein
MKQVSRSVVSEVAVFFNFGFHGVNLDSMSISQYALTDLLSHIRNSVTTCAFNQEVSSENLAISKLEIDEIVFVTTTQPNALPKALTKFDFKITFRVFHTSSTVTSAAFEDVDKITKKMFEKITKMTFEPEFEPSPCFIKPDFRATCIRQHVCGIVALHI